MKTTGKKPNILFFMTDQHRFECLGAHGHSVIKTPNLDRLAQGGVDMQHCYAQSAICMPSRASFFTGQYLHAHGLQSNSKDADVRGLTMLPAMLRDNGYQTAVIGKSHEGNSTDAGFQHIRLCAGMNQGEQNDYAAYLRKHGFDRAWGGNDAMKAYDSYVNGVPYKHSVEAWTGNESLAFLKKRDTNKPFFLWCSFERPHAPTCVPKDNPFPYDPKKIQLPPYAEHWYAGPHTKRPGCENMWNVFHTGEDVLRQAISNYLSLITMIDDQIGRIVKHLEQAGELENTIIVFSADHGDFAGEFGQFGKNLSTFDVLYRIPMILYWQGQTGHERIYELSESIDLMPTLLDLVGIETPRTVQGTSWAPLAHGSPLRCGQPWDGKEAVFFETPFVKTVRTKTHKLSYCWKGDRSWGQLYDLFHDPGETDNLYANPVYAWVQRDLEQRLINWFIATQQPQVHGAGVDETLPPWRWYQAPEGRAH